MPYPIIIPGESGPTVTTVAIDFSSEADYSYTVASTLSGGPLDGWEINNPARVTSLAVVSGVLVLTTNGTSTVRPGFDEETANILTISYPGLVTSDFTNELRYQKGTGHPWTAVGAIGWLADEDTATRDRSTVASLVPHLGTFAATAYTRDVSALTLSITGSPTGTVDHWVKLERVGSDMTWSFKLNSDPSYTTMRQGVYSALGGAHRVGLGVGLHSTSTADVHNIKQINMSFTPYAAP